MSVKSILVILIFLGVILRIYRVMEYPIQLGHDEISQLYDAISIAQTGRDIYGNFLPTTFISIHDFKSPFYTYAVSLTYLLLGDHEWIIKVPGLLFSILMIPAVYFFTSSLFKNKIIGLISAFLTVIAPFEIFYGRKSFENVAGIFCFLVGFSFLNSFIDSQRQRNLIFGIIILAIGMYTYFSHAVIIPLLLIFYLIIYKKEYLKNKLQIFKMLLAWGILITPLVLVILFDPGSRYRSQTVFITQDPELGDKLLQLGNPISKFLTLFDFSFQRYLSQFNLEYLFLNGLDLTNQGPLGVGPLLFIGLPFLTLGAYFLVKQKEYLKARLLLFSWIIVGMMPSGLTFEKFSPHRSIMVFTLLNIITGLGLYYFIRIIKNCNQKIRLLIITIVSILFIFNFIYFIHIYFVDYANEKSQELHYPFKQVALFAKEKYPDFELIIFDPKFGKDFPTIGTASQYYLGYYGKFPPQKMQTEYKIGDQSKRETQFGKFSIRAVNWTDDHNLKNTLLIASPWSLEIGNLDRTKIIKTFYFPDGKVAFYGLKL